MKAVAQHGGANLQEGQGQAPVPQLSHLVLGHVGVSKRHKGKWFKVTHVIADGYGRNLTRPNEQGKGKAKPNHQVC